jgi:hypothetical protein
MQSRSIGSVEGHGTGIGRCERREDFFFSSLRLNNPLSSTVATQGFRKLVGNLAWVIFFFFIYLGKGTTYRVSAANTLTKILFCYI